jgi:glutathione peroxidase-family protein
MISADRNRAAKRKSPTSAAPTYGVKFPMMAKTDIAAPKTHPFYKQLIAKTGAAPQWNFHKYLIDRSGNKVVSYDTHQTRRQGLLAQPRTLAGQK